MHLFPKTKEEWIKTILFPFKVHLAIAFLIFLLIGAPREIYGFWPCPVAIVSMCGAFIGIGANIDFLAFLSAGVVLLMWRRYSDAKKSFAFAVATAIFFICAMPGFGVAK